MTDLWTYIKETDKPIALYGTGNGADKILDKLISDGTIDKVKGVFASSGFVRNKMFRGYQIESYEDVKARLGDMIVLMCFGSSRPEVLENVDRLRAENEFYAPDVPVYGDTLFDNEFYSDNKYSFDKVRLLLADELSVKTFDSLINFKLTGDISYIYDCAISGDEADSLICNPESFLDLGAYNGDTVHRYSSMFPSVNSITAVEPDSRNYRKLLENTRDINIEINAINAVISDVLGESTISNKKGGRGVSETDTGTITIPSVTIDSVIGDKSIDFIKFDVEGNEAKAIRGGANVIANMKPQMLVSAYHRSEDLFELPLLVNSINPGYKIYLRQLKHVPAWDTAFYFI